MKYSVGQVLFVALVRDNKIIPVQVIEEITKKTLQGEEVSYLFNTLDFSTTPLTAQQIMNKGGEIFESAEKVREVLTDRATQAITRLVNAAIAHSNEHFTNVVEQPTVKTITHDDTVIELPDGRKARLGKIELPDSLKT